MGVNEGRSSVSPTFSPVDAFWQGKRVFVTGHTGFKGTWLTLWLSHLGANVRGYALPPETSPNMFNALGVSEACEHFVGDLCDRASLETAVLDFKPHVVIHMAAQSLVRRSYREPSKTFETNVIGTVNVLEVCRQDANIRSIVVLTTDKCYEVREIGRPFQEDDPLGGHDPYSASKACAEIVASAYRQSFFSVSPSPALATARGGNVIGGGDWGEDRLIPDAARSFQNGEMVVIRNPESVRPWQHVTELVAGYLLLAEALYREGKTYAKPFNFGPSAGQSFTVREVTERFANAWGDGAEFVAAEDNAEVYEARLLSIDSSRAMEMLGWNPRCNLDSGLRATAEWYRAYYAGEKGEMLRSLTIKQFAEFVETFPGQAVESSRE